MTSEDSEKIRELYEIYEQPMFRIGLEISAFLTPLDAYMADWSRSQRMVISLGEKPASITSLRSM